MLTFEVLRKANIARLPLFKNNKGLPAHSKPDGSDWSIVQWCNATLGEVGEFANLNKKVSCGDKTIDDVRTDAGKEIADILIYLDILAFRIESELNLDARYFTAYAKEIHQELNIDQNFIGNSGYTLTIAKNLYEIVEIFYSGDNKITKLHKFLAESFALLKIFAYMYNLDLGIITINKFNEVSRRVGVNIFIKEDGSDIYYE